MSTFKQENLAQITLEHPELVRDGRKAKLVELGGYGNSIQKTPAKVLNSVGYKRALAKLGLTEAFITKALVDDIKAKPKKRVRELELGADILSMRKREERENPNQVIIVNVSEAVAKKYDITPQTERDS